MIVCAYIGLSLAIISFAIRIFYHIGKYINEDNFGAALICGIIGLAEIAIFIIGIIGIATR